MGCEMTSAEKYESYVQSAKILKAVHHALIYAITNPDVQRVFSKTERASLQRAIHHVDTLINVGDVKVFREFNGKDPNELRHIFY